jgi:hypothetical protein
MIHVAKKAPLGTFLNCGLNASYQSRMVKNYRVATEDIRILSTQKGIHPFQKNYSASLAWLEPHAGYFLFLFSG